MYRIIRHQADVGVGRSKTSQCGDTVNRELNGTHCLEALCAAAGHQADNRHSNAMLSAKLLQCLSVSLSLIAKSEALSHDHARDLIWTLVFVCNLYSNLKTVTLPHHMSAAWKYKLQCAHYSHSTTMHTFSKHRAWAALQRDGFRMVSEERFSP